MEQVKFYLKTKLRLITQCTMALLLVTFTHSALAYLPYPLTLATWESEYQNSHPLAAVESYHVEDYSESNYACRAFIGKTGKNNYQLVFTVTKGVVRVETKLEERTRKSTRYTEKLAYNWSYGLGVPYFLFHLFTNNLQYSLEADDYMETYMEEVKIEKIVSEGCDQLQLKKTYAFIDSLSKGAVYTFSMPGVPSFEAKYQGSRKAIYGPVTYEYLSLNTNVAKSFSIVDYSNDGPELYTGEFPSKDRNKRYWESVGLVEASQSDRHEKMESLQTRFFSGRKVSVTGYWEKSAGQSYASDNNPEYWFEIIRPGRVQINLSSVPNTSGNFFTDPYLYLLDKEGNVLYVNDDAKHDDPEYPNVDSPLSTDSAIVTKSLDKGIYRIVAATYAPEKTGRFKLMITGLNITGINPQEVPDIKLPRINLLAGPFNAKIAYGIDAGINRSVSHQNVKTFNQRARIGAFVNTVIYKSDNEEVASVDNRGTVSIKGIGNATISMTNATDPNYTDSYNLEVK